MRTAIGYIRVSTDIQVEEGQGLDIQRSEIEEYCQKHKISLLGIHSDEGLSGAKLFQRKGLMELLDRLECESVDLLLVSKMDRLSRDAEAKGWIHFDMQRRGVKTKIHSLVESENREGKDAITRMFNSLISYLAEIERERITARLSAGRAHKRKSGGWGGGRAPLGYVSERGSKVLKVNPEKAETVRRLFQLWEQGQTYTQIAEILNTEGHNTQENSFFTAKQVKRAIDKEDVYKGSTQAPVIL